MKTTFEILNSMVNEGVFQSYAIGGAIGASLYLEPTATFDIDIFVVLPQSPGRGLVSVAPIYEYLTERGFKPHAEHIIIEDWPVQFLVAGDRLEDEAVAQAADAELEGVRARIMTAEHLIAIALRTGRAKDYSRVLQFLEQYSIDHKRLQSILSRHGLVSAWQRFKRRFLGSADE
ncbi:MAG: hypothetical protein ABSD20_15800 [Terriglobales bacterium]